MAVSKLEDNVICLRRPKQLAIAMWRGCDIRAPYLIAGMPGWTVTLANLGLGYAKRIIKRYTNPRML